MRALFLLPWGFFLLGLLPWPWRTPWGRRGGAVFSPPYSLPPWRASTPASPWPFPSSSPWCWGSAFWPLSAPWKAPCAWWGLTPRLRRPWGVLGALALGVAFFLGTGREAPFFPLPGVGTREDLLRLAGALEGLALRRPLVLVYLATEAPPERLEAELRRGDLAFRLRGVPPRPPGGPPRGRPGPPQAAPGPVSPLGLRGGALAGEAWRRCSPARRRGPPPVLKRCSLLVPTPTRGVRVYPLEPPASLGLPLPWGLGRWTMEQGKAISEAWKEALETYGEREEE